MRIVQTFWSAGYDPLENSFGWSRPEYNLMSWTLSCLSLRKYYDEVALYTDIQGKRVLIDMLHLPYTEVHVVYDAMLCLPQHWAYAKIKTYSMQTKPFLHVDGDVFLTQPIPEGIISAPLIAQNREIGTMYYKYMMDRILQEPAIKLPQYIEDGLKEESISSHNMGLFGGSDLQFIHQYCQEVIRFMDDNKMNDSRYSQSFIDCNVFFEQVIFAVLSDFHKREVASIMGRAICDEGYTRQEFCNFRKFGEDKLLHLLGGHKRNKNITRSFERFMLTHHPDLVVNVLKLVNKRHKYNCLSCSRAQINNIIYQIVPGFEDFIEKKLVSDMQACDADVLINEEKQKVATLPFNDEKKRQDSFVERTIGLSIYELPDGISGADMEKLKKILECECHFPLSHIAVYPSLRQDFLEVVPLEQTGFNTLMGIGDKVMSIYELCAQIIKENCQIEGAVSEPLLKFAMQHIKYLINTGILKIIESSK